MVVHSDKLRWLFWLRWKMVSRGYAGNAGRIVSAVILIIFILLFVGAIAVATYFGYHNLAAPANAEILFLVLTGLYLLWIVLPLLEFTFNEGLDLSKLALFPLTRGELMLGLIFSTLLDIPTLGLVLMLGAVVVGWAFSAPVALMTLLTMLVFYVQLIGISQLFLALLSRTLQSRRFRDLSIVMIPLLSISCYLFQRFVFLGIGTTNFIENLKNASFSAYLQWLPPGMAARAVQEASQGNWGLSFAWVAALIVITVVVYYLWQSIVERGLVSTESTATARVRQRRTSVQVSATTGQARPASFIERIQSSQAFAIAIKDMKYYRRDPQLQRMLLQSLTSAVLLFVVYVLSPGGSAHPLISGQWVVLFAPVIAFFSFYTLSYNILGFERQNLTTLFLFPIDPRLILWGKNLVTFAVGLIEVVVIVMVAAVMTQAWSLVPAALAIGLTAILIVLGCGNFSSTYLPSKMPQIGRGFRTSSTLSTNAGCQRGLLGIGVFIAMVVVIAPAALAMVLPIIYNAEWVWVITIPASLLYGAVFYFVVTNLVAPRILDKAPEILAVVARE